MDPAYPPHSLFSRSFPISRTPPAVQQSARSNSGGRLTITATPIPPAAVVERGIHIGNDSAGNGAGKGGCEWTVSSTKTGTISNSHELDSISPPIPLPHLPDMLFGSHRLTLTHHRSNFMLSFSPTDALRCVNPHKAEEGVEVEAAGHWKRSRKAPQDGAPSPRASDSREGTEMQVVRPYDWTFTPWGYKGTITASSPSSASDSVDPDSPTGGISPMVHRSSELPPPKTVLSSSGTPLEYALSPRDVPIDYDLLRRRDPILFFDEVVLYEDELSDNGTTSLSVKVRVMPHSILVLLRHFLRVDHVLVRVTDTRVFAVFSPPARAPGRQNEGGMSLPQAYSPVTPAGMLVREHRVSQVPYDAVKNRLTKKQSPAGASVANAHATIQARLPTSTGLAYVAQPLRGAAGSKMAPPPARTGAAYSGEKSHRAEDEELDLSVMTDRDRVAQCVEEMLDAAFGEGKVGGSRGGKEKDESWRELSRDCFVLG